MILPKKSMTKSFLIDNTDNAIKLFEEINLISEGRAERIATLNNDKAELLMENEQLRNTKKELLEQIKHLSELNGEYRRERHDMEDKLIEATTPWYVKLNNKLRKLGIRNPFYIQS
jgi:hypothetical protein